MWNEHSYHVTNVADDGTIPAPEIANWTSPGLNDFRQNLETTGLFNAPDLVPAELRADYRMCSATLVLEARVLNQGTSGAPAGVPVAFYRGTAAVPMRLLGVGSTTSRLLPGESELVSYAWSDVRATTEEPATFWVVVDADATGAGIVNECTETNNTLAPPLSTACSPLL